MRERPILFNADMVRAVLAGTKTQTRRAIKPQPHTAWTEGDTEGDLAIFSGPNIKGLETAKCPYGMPGDLLWVRETFAIESNLGIETEDRYPPPFNDGRPIQWHDTDGERWWQQCHYRATDPEPDLSYEDHDEPGVRWRPSIHMPRWASRLTLRITDVRVQRVQEISGADAAAEGVDYIPAAPAALNHRTAFADLWDKISKPGSRWADNPWVWAISFEVQL